MKGNAIILLQILSIFCVIQFTKIRMQLNKNRIASLADTIIDFNAQQSVNVWLEIWIYNLRMWYTY